MIATDPWAEVVGQPELVRRLRAAALAGDVTVHGDLVLYPATSLHRVSPVTRGRMPSALPITKT